MFVGNQVSEEQKGTDDDQLVDEQVINLVSEEIEGTDKDYQVEGHVQEVVESQKNNQEEDCRPCQTVVENLEQSEDTCEEHEVASQANYQEHEQPYPIIKLVPEEHEGSDGDHRVEVLRQEVLESQENNQEEDGRPSQSVVEDLEQQVENLEQQDKDTDEDHKARSRANDQEDEQQHQIINLVSEEQEGTDEDHRGTVFGEEVLASQHKNQQEEDESKS